MFSVGCDRTGKLQVDRIDPIVGDIHGNQQVRVLGRGFRLDGDYSVYFGGKRASKVGIANANTLGVTTPPGGVAGKVDVTITSDTGDAFRIRGGYEYKDLSGNVLEHLQGVKNR